MNDYIHLLSALFERQFSEAYRGITAKRRTQVLIFIPNIFRRWYYSALVESTPLTPANIVASVCAAGGLPTDTYPDAVSNSYTKWAGINVNTREYLISQHPIIDDLKALVDYCTPDINLFEEDFFSKEQAAGISEKLSLKDPYYAIFLLELAMGMGLINKIPSIYANIAQVAKDADIRLSAAPEELFDEIVEAAITYSAVNLCNHVPLPEPVFTEAFIRQLLKEPMVTDEIFECVYDTLGFSLEDLFDEEMQEEFEDFDASIITGTYLTGIVLDKYFFTPFSYFLKLIRPIYVLPFDFSQELKFFFDSMNSPDAVSSQFYAPCSHYFFTELGLKQFNLKATSDNYADAAFYLPFDSLKTNFFESPAIMNSLPIWANEALPDGFPFLQPAGKAYTFKIKLTDVPAYWIILDMPEEATLHRLYLEVLRYFYFERNDDYSFFLGKVENPFTEYSVPRRAKKAKNLTDVTLRELDFEYSKTMLLVVRGQGEESQLQSFRLILDMTDENPKEPRVMYPSLVKMSKELKNMHVDEWEHF